MFISSAGFDAAIGDQLGGCKVSPEAYGHFTHWLSSLANGKIILLLEGGYNVNSISHSMALCAKSLLADPLPTFQISSRWNGINSSALETLQNVIRTQETYWKCLKFNKKLPDYDLNENELHDKLIKDMEAVKLTDSDDKNNQSNSSNMSGTSSDDCGNPGPSKPAEKKQTLTDFLNDNLQVRFFFC